MTFARALRETMDELNLTVAQVARSIEVTEGAVYKQLAGGEPSRPTYDRMRRAYPGLAERMDRAVVA